MLCHNLQWDHYYNIIVYDEKHHLEQDLPHHQGEKEESEDEDFDLNQENMKKSQ